ncbi:DUF4376 domain-containing protein [Pseudomonas sp. McL0111]|uniref:DUF4376 domain-containing protein n=1 Tax=Pseudomonas sp. McL0111 TaxID=3457357 RepID=UPI00403EAD4E
MTKYAIFDGSGILAGRYDSTLHADIPDGAIAITAELFRRTVIESDGVWRLVDGDVVKEPFAEVMPDYAQLVAAERYKREAIGVFVDGLQIETSRESQALITSIGLSAVLDSAYRCNYKMVTGFFEIGSPQIIAISKAVRAHVQACYDRELALLQAIEAGTYTDEMLTEGWPDSPPATPLPAPQ